MHPKDLIEKHFKLTQIQKKGLEKLKLETLADLLLYLPSRHQAHGQIKAIKDIEKGETAAIVGKILNVKTSKAWKRKIPMGEATIEDETGKIKAIWFHQPYLAKKLTSGMTVQLTGKVSERKEDLYLANPDISQGNYGQKAESLFNHGSEKILTPIYSETRGISSGWIYYHVQKILLNKAHELLIDPLPEVLRKKYNLPTLSTALVWIHSPKKEENIQSAQKRFAFEEIFFIQLGRQRDRSGYHHQPAFSISIPQKEIEGFTDRFPFPLTNGQDKAIGSILGDLKKEEPMMRLLEGDVGSGKTAVAATATFAAIKAGFEVAYMAPTEILARQHFESFIEYFAHLGINVGLLTGKECRKFPSKVNPYEHTHISRAQLLKWVAEGIIPIVIGTHALIQKSVKFKNLALVIIDEQHRFGIIQRSNLLKKDSDKVPHLLSMTATPIPRTLSLTLYGDLDITILDEMPKGRKVVKTEIIPSDKRSEMYDHVREILKNGRQAFVICPRIEEPDPTKALALNVKSAKAEQKRLQKNVFPEFKIGLMHSKLKPAEKEEVMDKFTSGEIDILVSTSVVEVGVNVPNATVIIIEGAERYGLAQLHQLRGRVTRSDHQSYCYILTDSTSNISKQRLKSLVNAKNGFELAELDLSLRGSGGLSGLKQWGISDIGMEALKNIKMVEAARLEAKNIVEQSPNLDKYPLLKKAVGNQIIHFE